MLELGRVRFFCSRLRFHFQALALSGSKMAVRESCRVMTLGLELGCAILVPFRRKPTLRVHTNLYKYG